MNRVQDEMVNYREMMLKYKKQLTEVGNSIVNQVLIIIEENNRKIPEALDSMIENHAKLEMRKKLKQGGTANLLE